MQVGVAVPLIVEVIESRRTEAFAIGQDQVVGAVQGQGQCRVPGVLAAELLVVVVTKPQLGRKCVAGVTMLGEGRSVPA